ncbi:MULTISPECIES: 16S rRNA (guanine(527)-N(7))-methyltransferase RsmG [Rubrivivax]|uniref:Ribosomal RNA small subunit methyltransferase G n=1 Tax=Rubrivivax benzoatilyticus TaxID=316997 RepID=A0ABX0HZ09_9BURK|nr:MULTISPECIES: 16S rRNA (guanine(527)-N(7))-methyltransferase RsmG [Rubrivivax]EGJ09461.1 16S rRNA methyltransferase GidB [Rubrivivax benzoatilyticus JA2 = ATCC BAA-35]MCD0421102.1 16S rRNA (guanine(527)-N(7))-methyltransferase RsmG [Rubrivivax sp. JA1024]NHK98773.1 16S rRNA (guanine(527)-N(7))-methyltransferase RsmG [Rubrivivax benzoatilyticus]NHL24275.1 16S rRNA (guanine(527)-N(7))-methyltransferase RsmG [Rubrivivax benzoatilyticus]
MTATTPAAVCAALGLEVTPGQVEALERYLALLQRWNATYNLTAVRDPAQMLTQHLADCLAVVKPLAARLPAGRVLDVGSGGGLPGVVLAIMGWDVTCVDTVGKKAAFIRQAAAELRLPRLQAQHARVEQLKAAPFDVVTSRAFSSLADFVTLTSALLKPDACWMAMKGRVPDDEIAALPTGVEVFHVEHLSVPGLDAQRCLVWMRKT